MGVADLDAVRTLALDQHGVVTIAQLEGVLTRRQRERAIEEGWLVPVARGVYVLAGSPPTTAQELQIGLFRLGRNATVSHEAGGNLHRFDRSDPRAVEFTMPRGSRGNWAGLRVHTTSHLGSADVVRVGGFPCTSATRTILDLARAGITRVRLEAAIDSAVRTGASSPVVLAARLDSLRGPGRWGCTKIDTLLPDTGGHTRLERRFLAIVRQAGRPRPTTQVMYRKGGRTFARVDFSWPDRLLVVEVSGRLGHRSDAEAAKDAQRRNELQTIGYRVYEFTSEHVFDHPEYVSTEMRQLLPLT